MALEVQKWNVKFADAARFRQPHNANRPDANNELERMIPENQPVKIYVAAGEFKIKHGSVHHIIHKVLEYRKYLLNL